MLISLSLLKTGGTALLMAFRLIFLTVLAGATTYPQGASVFGTFIIAATEILGSATSYPWRTSAFGALVIAAEKYVTRKFGALRS